MTLCKAASGIKRPVTDMTDVITFGVSVRRVVLRDGDKFLNGEIISLYIKR